MLLVRTSLLSLSHRSRRLTMMTPSSENRTDLYEAKRELRASVKASLKRLTPQRMDEESSKICLNVLDLDAFKSAKRIGVYMHCPRLNEVNTSWIVAEALQQGKQCFCPRVVNSNAHMELLHVESDKDLVEVLPFGIPEPTPNYEHNNTPRLNALEAGLDLLLVPGLGFDRTGGRLGRGGGYYDAFIQASIEAATSHQWPTPYLIGLAFECQVQPNAVPVGPTDRHMQFLVTSRQTYDCKAQETR